MKKGKISGLDLLRPELIKGNVSSGTGAIDALIAKSTINNRNNCGFFSYIQ